MTESSSFKTIYSHSLCWFSNTYKDIYFFDLSIRSLHIECIACINYDRWWSLIPHKHWILVVLSKFLWYKYIDTLTERTPVYVKIEHLTNTVTEPLYSSKCFTIRRNSDACTFFLLKKLANYSWRLVIIGVTFIVA
jgi:hypothetical protein